MKSVNEYLTNMYDELVTYLSQTEDITDKLQIIVDNQEVPEEELKYPRIMYDIISNYISESGSPVKYKELVPGTNGFEFDIKYTYERAPLMILSFEGYGIKKNDNIWTYMKAIYDWFVLRDLSEDAMNRMEVVIRDVSNIEGRSVVFNEFEERYGFSVLLNVSDVVELKVPTIEIIDTIKATYKE